MTSEWRDPADRLSIRPRGFAIRLLSITAITRPSGRGASPSATRPPKSVSRRHRPACSATRRPEAAASDRPPDRPPYSTSSARRRCRRTARHPEIGCGDACLGLTHLRRHKGWAHCRRRQTSVGVADLQTSRTRSTARLGFDGYRSAVPSRKRLDYQRAVSAESSRLDDSAISSRRQPEAGRSDGAAHGRLCSPAPRCWPRPDGGSRASRWSRPRTGPTWGSTCVGTLPRRPRHRFRSAPTHRTSSHCERRNRTLAEPRGHVPARPASSCGDWHDRLRRSM
jgi:hypothetical protein